MAASDQAKMAGRSTDDLLREYGVQRWLQGKAECVWRTPAKWQTKDECLNEARERSARALAAYREIRRRLEDDRAQMDRMSEEIARLRQRLEEMNAD